jgi:fused signal recognition particle receptor
MSRTWAELLGDADDGEREAAERTGFLSRLRESLDKSRRALTAELTGSFDASEDDAWERLELALIRADVGVPATAELVRRLEARGELSDLGSALAEEVERLFGEPPTLARSPVPPTVVLVVGVNGTGKTTTIGKLARKLAEHGRSVLVGAADTFRAAADEQLEIWAERAGAEFVGGSRGADPAAVAFDATTGQNGLQQARLFSETAGVTGVALTKLDGSAKGGVAVAIAHELGLPVKLVGVGEGLDDLRPFDARDYATALVRD